MAGIWQDAVCTAEFQGLLGGRCCSRLTEEARFELCLQGLRVGVPGRGTACEVSTWRSTGGMWKHDARKQLHAVSGTEVVGVGQKGERRLERRHQPVASCRPPRELETVSGSKRKRLSYLP